ncbi:IQ-domain 13 isoform X2 [Carex rostrata]
MGKKGNWFFAIKRAFTGSSKDKPLTAYVEKKDNKDKKKWVFGKPKNGEISTFIPLCREPSSIEKILGDAERDSEEPYKRHHQRPPNRRSVETERAQYWTRYRRSIEHESDPYHNRISVEVYNHGDPYNNMVHQTPSNRLHHVQQVDQNRLPQIPSNRFEEQEQKSLHQVHLQMAQNECDLHHRGTNVAPKKAQMVHVRRPKINPNVAHTSALKIQKAFRGYLARRNYLALKGLIRLQTMMRGNGIKRQTIEAMNQMRLLVKVQTQIHARRVEMMESRASQSYHTSETEPKGDYSWNDSVLTKEEAEARMKSKVEAIMKRERALAYAYSHQLLRAPPAMATAILADLHSGVNQWCWTPFDRHPRDESCVNPRIKLPTQIQHGFNTPNEPYGKPKIKNPIETQFEFGRDLHLPDKSYEKPKIKHPIQTLQTQLQFISRSPLQEFTSSSKPKLKAKTKPSPIIRDDDSLTSCPPFTVPNYMAPTVSAKAKVKAKVHEKNEDKRGFSLGSIKWGKGSFWKETAPSEVSRRHRKTLSITSGISIDSAVSMPVVVGRRPFR